MDMTKANDAFRTISEVSEWLDTPTHVLRFWESKFSQINPVKGAGGRRYYRPVDIDLLSGIKQLLHEDGLTIKGAQKLLHEKGAKHVATLGRSITQELAAAQDTPAAAPAPAKPPEDQKILPFDGPRKEPAFVHDRTADHGPTFVHADTDHPEESDPTPQIDMPPLPAGLPAVSGRLLGRIPADLAGLQARAAEIAPLLARLENLHDRMRPQ